MDKGMKHGQKITFGGEADQAPGVEPGDIVLVLQEKDHEVGGPVPKYCSRTHIQTANFPDACRVLIFFYYDLGHMLAYVLVLYINMNYSCPCQGDLSYVNFCY